MLYFGDGSKRSAQGVNEVMGPVAGNGSRGFSGDGGPATQAALNYAHLALAPNGSVLVADSYNHRIRRVGTDGIISTLAGTGVAGYSGDGGPATQAALNVTWGVAAAPDGGVLIADYGNHRIRRVRPDGIITTLAGTGTIALLSTCEIIVFEPPRRYAPPLFIQGGEIL